MSFFFLVVSKFITLLCLNLCGHHITIVLAHFNRSFFSPVGGHALSLPQLVWDLKGFVVVVVGGGGHALSGPTLFGLRVEKRVDGTGRINFRRESPFLAVHNNNNNNIAFQSPF